MVGSRMTKDCMKCGAKIGRNNTSGLCAKDLKSKYYFDNLNKSRDDMKAWRKRNADRCRANRKRWFSQNPDKKRQMDVQYHTSVTGRFHFGKRHAKIRNIEWNVTLEEFKPIIKNPCAYCGTVNLGLGVGIDRIDSALPYEPSNMIACCGTCNKIKHNALTYEEMKVAMSAVQKLRNEKTLA